MKFLTLAKKRCTTRGFKTKPITPRILNYILESSRVAPSACNKQPQRILVIQTKDGLSKVEKAYKSFNSPCVLIVCQDKAHPLIRPYDGKCSGDLDIGIVCDHIMLAAREKNIGSVMVGLFDPAIIRFEFGIPNDIEPTALVLLGYPEQGFLPMNRHKTERKPISDTVQFETYSVNMESR
jgi:nitroreductase